MTITAQAVIMNVTKMVISVILGSVFLVMPLQAAPNGMNVH
jgi:hypothetical protein